MLNMTSYRHPYCETDSGSASAAAARLPYSHSIPGFDLKAVNRFNFGALEPFSAKTEPFSIPISTFWYLSGRLDNTLDEYDAEGSAGYGNLATPSTTNSGVLTPSTTTDMNTLPLDDEHAANTGPPDWAASNITQHHSVGMPLSPEPKVLLAELQKAAEDVSQIVGRFGFKMASQL